MSEEGVKDEGVARGERYAIYAIGWKDGARCICMRVIHEGNPDYEAGYKAGRLARNEALTAFARSIGRTLSVLRHQDDRIFLKEDGRP